MEIPVPAFPCLPRARRSEPGPSRARGSSCNPGNAESRSWERRRQGQGQGQGRALWSWQPLPSPLGRAGSHFYPLRKSSQGAALFSTAQPWLSREFQHCRYSQETAAGGRGDWDGGRERPGCLTPVTNVHKCPSVPPRDGPAAAPQGRAAPIDLISTAPNPLRRLNRGAERLWNEEGKGGLA